MKMLSLFYKVEIGISLIPFLIVILLTGYYKLFFTYFIIVFIHELGHVVVASVFNVKVDKITINIFGCSASLEDHKYLDFYKQIFIFIAGPLTYFISSFLIDKLYVNEVISLVTYYKAIFTNKYVLIFNLLPIFPLDGGRILKLIIERFFTFKASKIISLFISFIFITLFIVYTSECKQYLIYVFTILNFISGVASIEKEWKHFLISRYYFINKYKDKIHNKNDLYIYRDNYCIKEKRVLNEKQMIERILKN